MTRSSGNWKQKPGNFDALPTGGKLSRPFFSAFPLFHHQCEQPAPLSKDKKKDIKPLDIPPFCPSIKKISKIFLMKIVVTSILLNVSLPGWPRFYEQREAWHDAQQ